MNRKVLLIVLALIAIVATGTVFTAALFSDSATSGVNTFTAGTLDLAVDGASDASGFQDFSIENLGADGVVTGGASWVVTNTGIVPGYLTFSVVDVVDSENECIEPEIEDEPFCTSNEFGELGAKMSARVFVDQDASGDTYSDEQVGVGIMSYTEFESWVSNDWSSFSSSLPDGQLVLESGESAEVTLNWQTDAATLDNSVQSDSLEFRVRFDLTQRTPS